MATAIRLVLADDHPLVLAGLGHLFSTEPGFMVLAQVASGDLALSAVRQHHPDVLVLDLRMPGLDGLAVLAALRAEKSSTRVVVLTASDSEDVLRAVRMGVDGVVLKDMAPELLVRCVRAVHGGARWIEKNTANRAIGDLLSRESEERELAARLTPRELQVARLIAEGLSNKVVASRLRIAEGTVKLHIHHVYEKLGLDGRVGLLRYLQSRGLL